MVEEEKQARKQVNFVRKGLKILLGMAKPDARALSDPRIEALFGVNAMTEVVEEVRRSMALAPQIAFIGKTGVGKSSTINELFDPQPHLPVDHIEPATIKMEIRELTLGERGKLYFVDCPGLGAGEEVDKRNISAYKEMLANCDVAVWIIKADDRTLGIDQTFVKDVLPEKLKDRLVIGINQIDKIEPGEWIYKANLPSKEQLESIARKEQVVRKSFNEVGLEPFAIVSFSAKRHYHLKLLFNAMVKACPEDRISALQESQGKIKSFLSEDIEIAKYLPSPSTNRSLWERFLSLFERSEK